MGIMIYRDRFAAAAAAATMTAARIIEKPGAVVGFGAFGAALPVYENLVDLTGAGALDWSEATAFHTSELMGKAGGGAVSGYLEKHLYRPVKMDMSRVLVPPCSAGNIEAGCNSFEDRLMDHGGMDILLLHLGRNGHIAFNGPAREFSAFTHVELLPESTIGECAAIFPGGAAKGCTQAVTMGMSTLFSAKQIILLAFGADIAPIAARMLSSAVTPAVPASMLQLHPCVTYMLDEDAAAEL